MNNPSRQPLSLNVAYRSVVTLLRLHSVCVVAVEEMFLLFLKALPADAGCWSLSAWLCGHHWPLWKWKLQSAHSHDSRTAGRSAQCFLFLQVTFLICAKLNPVCGTGNMFMSHSTQYRIFSSERGCDCRCVCAGHGVLHRSDSGEGAVSRRLQEDPRSGGRCQL